MRFPSLLLLCSCAFLSRADDLGAFANNDREIGSRSITDCREVVGQNLDLLIGQVLAARNDAGVNKVITRFDKVAHQNDDGYPTSFSWVSGSRSSAGGFQVVCVSYGPIGRVAIINPKGIQVHLGELMFMEQRRPEILLMKGTSLVVSSPFVRDAGVRENTQLQFIRLDEKPVLLQTMSFEHTLDWGGPRLVDGDLAVFSIDTPKSFFVANVDPILKHRRVFRVVDGRAQLIVDDPQDIPLRVLDGWMEDARRAKRPTSMQRVLRKFLPEMELIDSHEMKSYLDGSVAITMVGDKSQVRFALKPRGKTFVVTKAEGKVR